MSPGDAKGVLTLNSINDDGSGGQIDEFNFSIILMVLLGGFVLLRYIRKETGEKDLQFLGACIMLVMMFARYFFRSARRKSL